MSIGLTDLSTHDGHDTDLSCLKIKLYVSAPVPVAAVVHRFDSVVVVSLAELLDYSTSKQKAKVKRKMIKIKTKGKLTNDTE